MLNDNDGKNIRLVINGNIQCELWDEVSVDSQIDVPADAWSLTLFNPPEDDLPTSIKAGASCQLYFGNELILTGIIDQLTELVNRSGRVINISGRDLAGQLLDCSVEIINARQITLEQIAGDYITNGKFAPFPKVFSASENASVTVGRILLDSGLYQKIHKNKVSVEPSESIWDALVKIAASAGAWVWFTPDGVLRIGDPFANPYQVNTPIRLMRYGNENNALSLDYSEDVTGVFSHIKVLSQNDQGLQLMAQGEAQTPYQFPRLKIVTLDAENQAEAQAALNKIIHDNDLEAYSLNATVAGWTVDGKCWQAGFEVQVQSDVSPRANARWVAMGRTLKLSRTEGKTTVLKLKRKGDWTQPLLYKNKEHGND